jgi:energy-coupling factor transporter ATP-binding protein EcfA2
MQLNAGKEVVDVLSLAYASGQPVLLEGPHGVGKSQLVEQAASSLGVDYIVRDLSLMEPPDLIGLPKFENGKTVYAPPAFLPTKGKGLLVLEELNRCERYMRSPCLQLMTARCLNDYALPPGWLPVAALNPAGEAYDVQELDPALQSRFMRIEVRAEVKSWLAWAAKNGVHPAVRSYVEQLDRVFESSNPRSWAYVSNVVTAHESGGTSDRKALLAAVAGLVGDTHATAFMKTYRGEATATVSSETVLRSYKKVRTTVSGWARERKTDMLQSIAHSVMVALQNSDLCAEIRADAAMSKNLGSFIADLPADIGRKVKASAKQGGALP